MASRKLGLGLPAVQVSVACLLLTSAPAQAAGAPAPALPLVFVPNQGQLDPQVSFAARGLGGALFFTSREVVLVLPERSARLSPPQREPEPARARVARVQFVGASRAPRIRGTGPLPGVVHAFHGRDPARWRSHLPAFAAVTYEDLYPGVALRYEARTGGIKATYTLAPGADPARIRWRYLGGTPRLDTTGRLVVELEGREAAAGAGARLTEQAPVAWQESPSGRTPVRVRYALAGGAVGFVLPDGWDPARPLVLDPVLTYSTFLGGSAEDVGYHAAVDATGAVFVVGYTLSVNFPTLDPFDPTCGTDGTCNGAVSHDAFVAKLDPTVSGAASLLFSTYLGGSGSDYGVRAARDGGGNVYVVGLARADFPTTANAFQQVFGGGAGADAFLTKLSPDGSALLYSTYLGGSSGDGAWGLALNGAVAEVAGQTLSTDFPITPGALDSTCGTDGSCNGGASDAFLARVNTAASGVASLAYATFLGGSGQDQGYDVSRDGAGNVYLSGRTASTDFPLVNASQASNGGGFDAFVAKLDAAGSSLGYATYLGGSGYEDAYTIALDTGGRVHAVGTTSSADFPTTASAWQLAFGGGPYDAYYARLDPGAPGGSPPLYSTYLGGSADDEGFGLTLTASGRAYLGGFSLSTDYPVTAGAYQVANAGAYDAFLTKLDSGLSGASSLLYSTYFGGLSSDAIFGLALDASENVQVVGQTFSTNLPTVGAYQAAQAGGSDVFFAKLDGSAVPVELLSFGIE